MFGQDENQQQDQNNGAQAPQTDNQDSPMAGFTPPPIQDVTKPAEDNNVEAPGSSSLQEDPAAPAPGASSDPADTSTSDDNGMQLPGAEQPQDQQSGLTVPEPSSDETAAASPATGAPEPAGGAGLTASPNDLMRIKQDALQKLSPLVDHLDQSPEERFRTTMMMIQATDDSSMIESAYQAAEQITDEKVRAQALLDVVNEINYFAQQSQQQEQ